MICAINTNRLLAYQIIKGHAKTDDFALFMGHLVSKVEGI